MSGVIIIAAVMLFLWSTAAVATGMALLITDGCLGRREWFLFATGIILCMGLLAAYCLLGPHGELPPPHETALIRMALESRNLLAINR